jgi:hypothetical protein
MTKPSPASEADLTQDELSAAAADMELVLAAEPNLSDFGFGASNIRKMTAEERVAFVQENRARIRLPRSLAQFMAARQWLAQFGKLKALNRSGSSYGLKHVAGHDIGYVTNGVFIAAAIAEGFIVRRIWSVNDTANPNAWFNISSAAWRRREQPEDASP